MAPRPQVCPGRLVAATVARMPSPSAALDLLLRADAEPWAWTVAELPVLASRLGLPAPSPGADHHSIALGDSLVLPVDRRRLPQRLVVGVEARGGYRELCTAACRRCGPYATARRGPLVRRWWRLASGRHLEAVAAAPGSLPGPVPVTLELVRAGSVPPRAASPDAMADAAADLAVRIVDAGYVPVEDETLPDLAAALGGRLSWGPPAARHRHIDLARPPFHLELASPVTSEPGLTWYEELRVDLYGSDDTPGVSRAAAYRSATAAVARRYGDPTRPGPEACYWERDNGWTLAVDRSSGVVRMRIRPPAEPPVRPPE